MAAKKPQIRSSTMLKINIPHGGFMLVMFILNLAVAGSILILQNSLPPEVPLFYGMPSGREQLADQIYLLIPPAAALLIIATSAVLSSSTRDSYLQTIFSGLTLVVTLLSTITVVKIMLLVGNF